MIAQANPLTSRNRLKYFPPLKDGSVSSGHNVPVDDVTYDFLNNPAPLDEDLDSYTSPPVPQKQIATQWQIRDLPNTILRILSASYSYLVLFLLKNVFDHSDEPNQQVIPPAPQPETVQEVQEVQAAPKPPKQEPILKQIGLYDSLYATDSSDDDLDGNDQYGLSLSIISKAPKRNIPRPRETGILDSKAILNSHLDPGSNLLDIDMSKPSVVPKSIRSPDILFTPKVPSTDYDDMVSKFYHHYKPFPQASTTLADSVLSNLDLYKSGNFIKEEQQHVQELITKERKAAQSAVKPLSADQQDTVYRYWRSKNASAPVVSAYSIDITVRDLLTLADGQWLNDNIIDFYLSLVTEKLPHVYCWTTHFFSTLKLKGYQGVARWAKRRKINLFEKDKIIVPINIMSTHWCVAVIDNKLNTISYHDSLASRGNLQAVELLQVYMTKEAERLGVGAPSYELLASSKTPQQQNGYDCGVFTCTVAKCISALAPLAFGQKDMHIIRQRMAYEIILKNLLEETSSAPHL